MELTGKILKIEELQQVSDNFKKQEVILFIENERNIEWSDKVKIEFQQKQTDLVADLNKDDEVTISINIRGREWTKDDKTMYFNTIVGWRVEKLESATAEMPEFNAADMPPAPEDDTLPF